MSFKGGAAYGFHGRQDPFHCRSSGVGGADGILCLPKFTIGLMASPALEQTLYLCHDWYVQEKVLNFFRKEMEDTKENN